jgi:plasmid maintenance system killer protein
MVRNIFENRGVYMYLKKRRLLSRYLKAKQCILDGEESSARMKKRQPKSDEIWDFRISKKYRAVGYFKGDGVFVVSYIDDHQKT